MTELNRPPLDVPALLDERRRYEVWLAALEARRDATPAHVFERVQTDYRRRLDQVAAELASRRQAIEEERANLQSRVSLLDAQERMRRDERSELDLRAHVGELGANDAAAAFSTVDDALEQVVSERTAVQRRVAELVALLAERPAAETVASQPAAQQVKPAQPVPQATQAQPARHVEQVQPVPQAEPPRTRVAASDGSTTPGGSFDELAFLDAVVGGSADESHAGATSTSAPPRAPHIGKPGPASPVQAEPPARPLEGAVVRDDSDAESLLAGLRDHGSRGSNAAPLAANVPANTPILLRPSGAMEQSKTLKCSECSAMNYPTEWYCERCGAELAAL
jgi:hypothetical protein